MAMAPCAPASVSVSFAARPAAGSPSSARPQRAAVAVRAAGATEGGRWWAPLLGWSGKADYLEAPAPVPVAAQDDAAARRQFLGVMTEEKARQLRARMAQTESFHDAMYHSAIASRLARAASSPLGGAAVAAAVCVDNSLPLAAPGVGGGEGRSNGRARGSWGFLACDPCLFHLPPPHCMFFEW